MITLSSPSSRIRITISGTNQLDESDAEWLQYHQRQPHLLNELLAKVQREQVDFSRLSKKHSTAHEEGKHDNDKRVGDTRPGDQGADLR